MPFARHQTFHIRESWLFKGMAAIKAAEEQEQQPTIFLDDDAPERLGIGRNMVMSLRFWMQATGLTTEEWEGRKVQRLTPFGEAVWGADRYLEDEGTLWLIHYHLACSEEQATTWYWFFNHYAPATFSVDTCWEALKDWAITYQPDKRVSERSLKRDIDCLLKTYTSNERATTPEDLLECPLSRLTIMQEVANGAEKHYRLERTSSRAVPPLIVLYVLLDRQNRARQGSSQVGLNQVLREPMNVGRVFNLTTNALVDVLTELNQHYPEYRVQFVRTAGLDQLTLPHAEPADILAHYYDLDPVPNEGSV